MNKALIIGDRNCAPHRSIAAALDILPGIWGCAFDAADESRYGALTYEGIKDYELIVFMPAYWPRNGSLDSAVALFTYVLHGGSLFVIGGGLDVGSTQELKVLTASVYKGCGYYTELDIHLAARVLVDSDGTMADANTVPAETITTRTIPYFVKPDVFKETSVLATFRYGRTDYPCLWTHTWSKGRIACLALDITRESAHALVPLLLLAKSALGDTTKSSPADTATPGLADTATPGLADTATPGPADTKEA